MKDIRTGKDRAEYPILKEPKLYIYIMLNDSGKVKIGKTKNIQQRYQSLSGSNSGGSKIEKCLVSPSTYLYTLESIMHNKFDRYRIPNTEWFYNKYDITGETLFNEVVNELRQLFSSTDYKKCNNLRKLLYENKELKEGDSHDD